MSAQRGATPTCRGAHAHTRKPTRPPPGAPSRRKKEALSLKPDGDFSLRLAFLALRCNR